MALHDYNLANQTPASYRTDHNNLSQAIATNNYSSSGITTTFQTAWFADASSNGWMRLRNTADSTHHHLFLLDKDGGLDTHAGNPSTNKQAKYQGQPLYDTTNNLLYYATLAGTSSQATWSQLVTSTQTSNAWPTRYRGGPPIKWNSVSQVVIPGGLRWRDEADSVNIGFSSNFTVDITVAGAGGLSTDLTEASNTWYYLFAIYKSTDGTVNGILTDSSSGPVYPSGYDKKALIFTVYNSTGSDFLKFHVASGWPWRPEVRWATLMAGYGETVGITNVLDGGTASTFTDVDCSKFTSPLSRTAILKVDMRGRSLALRPDGYSTDDYYRRFHTETSPMVEDSLMIELSSSRVIEYKSTDAVTGVDIAVLGYVMTEFPSS